MATKAPTAAATVAVAPDPEIPPVVDAPVADDTAGDDAPDGADVEDAVFVADPGFGHADNLIVADVPDPALVADDGSLAPRDPEFEAAADTINADLAATLIPMSAPDGATCDAYATNKAGHILVPAEEAAAMQSFGFTVVVGG